MRWLGQPAHALSRTKAVRLASVYASQRVCPEFAGPGALGWTPARERATLNPCGSQTADVLRRHGDRAPRLSDQERAMNLHRIVVALAAFFGLTFVLTAGSDTAKKLVGVWEITNNKEAPPGATVEFTRDGKMTVRAKVGEKELKIEGTYELKDDAIVTKLSVGGKTKTESNKIRKLTEKELIIVDEKGKVEEYKRVK
jgi:uncharacterized protein (TIGR03066 family)